MSEYVIHTVFKGKKVSTTVHAPKAPKLTEEEQEYSKVYEVVPILTTEGKSTGQSELRRVK